jgi:hypothetical protein
MIMEDKIITMCSSCVNGTNHRVLFQTQQESEKIDPFSKDKKPKNSKQEYCVVQCLGCETISFLRITKFEGKDPWHENFPDDDDDYDSALGSLSYEDMRELPKVIQRLYEEVEEALDSQSLVLTGMGLRALVEAVCKDQNIKGTNLKEKISALHSQGLISKVEEPILDKLRQIGNDSAHEIQSLPINKLEYAFGIINHILRSIYVLPRLNERLSLKPQKKKPVVVRGGG